MASILRSFPEEFVAHLEGSGCPRPRELPFPKIVDLGGGSAAYDRGYYLKQPDWTYASSSEEPEAPGSPRSPV